MHISRRKRALRHPRASARLRERRSLEGGQLVRHHRPDAVPRPRQCRRHLFLVAASLESGLRLLPAPPWAGSMRRCARHRHRGAPPAHRPMAASVGTGVTPVPDRRNRASPDSPPSHWCAAAGNQAAPAASALTRCCPKAASALRRGAPVRAAPALEFRCSPATRARGPATARARESVLWRGVAG